MMRRTAVLCLGTALLLAAAMPRAAADYSCPDDCNTKSDCQCGSNKIPGGIDAKDTPMFIVLTNDDAINPTTFPVITNITERHQNKDGCKMPATWFVSTNYTIASMVQQVFTMGHEIATHTMSHTSDPIVWEIAGARQWLNETAGIPLDKLQGFRSPFLKFSTAQREILAESGFRYDSSITERWNANNPTSPNASGMLWPYTMDEGIAQDCAVSTGTCTDSERWPGLWEFPMAVVQDSQGSAIAAMDAQGNNYEQYKQMFDDRYAGNRAPLGIFVHAGQLLTQPAHIDEINQFLDYALSHDNVYVATISQVLDWIDNPVPASKYEPACPTAAELKAELGAVKSCTAPVGGCVYGQFNSDSCACACQNEETGESGYCKDASGACTVQKTYNSTAEAYTCPGSSATAAAATPAPSADLGKPECGHDLVNYTGLAVSGDGNAAETYAQAIKAIDGSCSTCSQIAQQAAGGSFLTIMLNTTYDLASVVLRSSSEQPKIDILVGDDPANNGLNNPVCASGVVVGTGGGSTITVPCTGTGSVVTLRADGGMTLCDVYPQGTPVPPAPAGPQATIIVEVDIPGLTVAQFSAADSGKASALCQQLIALTGDKAATCEVVDMAAATSRRRLLEAGVHATAQVNTTSPDSLLSAFSTGTAAAAALQPAGLTVNPASAKAYYAGSAPAAGSSDAGAASAAPATSSDSASSASSSGGGSSGSLGAIIGGVVAGVAVVAAGLGIMVLIKRRRAAAKGVELSNASFNAAYDMGRAAGATATIDVVDSAAAKAKMASGMEAEDSNMSPLGASIASFSQPPREQQQ